MKRLLVLAILPILCSCGKSKIDPAEGLRAGIDQRKTIPPRADWTREIVARREGDMRYTIESPVPFTLIILTDKGFQAVKTGNRAGLSRSDVLLMKDFDPPSHDGTTHVPAGGSYWFSITNNSDKAQEIHLRVWDR